MMRMTTFVTIAALVFATSAVAGWWNNWQPWNITNPALVVMQTNPVTGSTVTVVIGQGGGSACVTQATGHEPFCVEAPETPEPVRVPE